jgi:integrase
MARGDGRIFLPPNTSMYHVAFNLNGREHRESAHTSDEEEARKYLRARLKKVHVSEVTGAVFETQKMRKVTVGDLLDGLKADYTLRGKASAQNLSYIEQVRADRADGDTLGDTLAVAITPEKVDSYVQEKLAQEYRPASVNRRLQMLSQAFTLAVRRGTLCRKPLIRKLSEAGNERRIPVTEGQLADFLAALPDDGLRDFAQWCAACAMRKGEASLLTWSMIRGGELCIPGTITKNKEGRVLPLVGELAAILDRRKKARRMDCQYIFHRAGKRVYTFDKARRTAAKKAHLPAGFVFHTLRSVAATNLIHAGVSPEVCLKVGGWKSPSMLKRYALLNTDDVADALTQTEKYRAEQAKKGARVVAMR